MPKIQMDVDSNLTAEQTFSKVRTFFEEDSELRQLDSDFSCEFNEDKLSGSAKGSKFSAEINVSDKSVAVMIEIPFVLSPFKGKIKETVEQKLSQLLS